MGSSQVAASLSLSLLTALGLSPLACGGTTEHAPTGTDPKPQPTSPPDNGKPKPTCTSPQTDAATGIVSCSEGYRYRSKRRLRLQLGHARRALPDRARTRCRASTARRMHRRSVGVPTTINSAFAARRASHRSRACESGLRGGRRLQPAAGVCATAPRRAGARFDQCDSDASDEPGYHCASYFEGCGSSSFVASFQRDCSACNSHDSGQRCIIQADGRASVVSVRSAVVRSW